MSLSLGQSLQLAQNSIHALCFIQCLVRRHTASGQALRKAVVQLLGLYAPSPVDGEIPCDTNQPHPHVAHSRQRTAMFENANKDILNDVLSLCSTAQDRVRYAEQQRGIYLHKSGGIDLGSHTFHGRQRQAASLDRRHKPLLSRQTLKYMFRSTIILFRWSKEHLSS